MVGPSSSCCLYISILVSVLFAAQAASTLSDDNHDMTPLELLPAEYYGQINLVRNENLASGTTTGIGLPADRARSWIAMDNVAGRYIPLSISVGRIDLKLRVKDSNKEAYSACTGTLISEKYVLTNHHCIPSDIQKVEILEASILFNYLFDEDENNALRLKLKLVPSEADQTLDYSIIEVAEDVNNRVTPIKVKVRSPASNEPVFLIHHPIGLPQVISHDLGACRIENRRVINTTLHHRCDTDAGSSGALLLADSDLSIIGLHRGAPYQKVIDKKSSNYATSMTAILADSKLLTALLSAEVNEVESSISNTQVVEVEAEAQSERLFASRFDDLAQMDSAGCKSAESLARDKLGGKCVEAGLPSLASYEKLACTNHGTRVKVYTVTVSGTCKM